MLTLHEVFNRLLNNHIVIIQLKVLTCQVQLSSDGVDFDDRGSDIEIEFEKTLIKAQKDVYNESLNQ